MKVDTLWMMAPGKIEIREIEVPDPDPDQIQIEIKACGICAWDQYLYKGIDLLSPYPFMFGHEGAGIVTKTGKSVTGFKKGDNVMCCGGANSMAQVVNMQASCAAVISSKVEDFSLWIGEPVACVINSLANVLIHPADEIVIIGTGYMGLLKIQGLFKSLAGRLIAFDIDDKRLMLAKEFGADEKYNIKSKESTMKIEQIIAKGGADYVIECSGTNAGFELANSMLKNAGILELFAWHRREQAFNGTSWHLKGITVYNTSPSIEKFYLPQRVRQAEKLMSKGIFSNKKLVTHKTDYRHAREAIEMAINKTDGYIKGVITF